MIPYFIVGSYMVSLTWLKFVSFASEPRLHFMRMRTLHLAGVARGHGTGRVYEQRRIRAVLRPGASPPLTLSRKLQPFGARRGIQLQILVRVLVLGSWVGVRRSFTFPYS